MKCTDRYCVPVQFECFYSHPVLTCLFVTAANESWNEGDCQDVLFARPPPNRTVITDGSWIVWGEGAYLRTLKIQSLWLEQEESCHINELELWAIYSVCRAFQDQIRRVAVQILTENTTPMYWVNKNGGACFNSFVRKSFGTFASRKISCLQLHAY